MRTNLENPVAARSLDEQANNPKRYIRRAARTEKAERPRWERKDQPKEPTLSYNDQYQSWELRLPGNPPDPFKERMRGFGFRYIYKGEHVWYNSRGGDTAKANGELLVSEFQKQADAVSSMQYGC